MKLREESFSIEHEGITYTATRVITGARKLRQVIHFKGAAEPDDMTYSPGDEANMRSTAQLILFQLIKRGSLRGSAR